jgi:acetyl esterase/lipase
MTLTAAIAAIVLTQNPVPMETMTFSKVEGVDLSMDVYSPPERTRAPRPAIVLLYGGAWMAGRKEDVRGIAQILARNGFTVAAPTYRLAPKHKWPAMIEDAQTAVRFVRSQSKEWGVDPNRIGSAGFSAGGHLALLLGSEETRLRKGLEYPKYSSRTTAILNIFGPTDMRRDFGPMFDPAFSTVLGKPRKDAAHEILDASPVAKLTAKSAPVFTIHGDRDPLVPVAQARWLTENLERLKIDHITIIVPGMAHNLDLTSRAQRSAFDRGVKFMQRQFGIE